MKFLETTDNLVDEQNGFGNGCVDIFNLHSVVSKYLKEDKQVFACFVDFCKAFDFVNRDLLWVQVARHGITGKILTAIKVMYQLTENAVAINGILSFKDFFHGLFQDHIESSMASSRIT